MKFKFKTERPGILVVSLFHLAVGVILASILAVFSFRFFHVGVLAVLNLILTYGLLKMKHWSVKLSALLCLPQVVFGLTTLYFIITIFGFSRTWEITGLNISLIVYVVLCVMSFTYVAAKRKDFK